MHGRGEWLRKLQPRRVMVCESRRGKSIRPLHRADRERRDPGSGYGNLQQNPSQSATATITVNPVAPGNNVVRGDSGLRAGEVLRQWRVCHGHHLRSWNRYLPNHRSPAGGHRLGWRATLGSGAAGGELSLSLPQVLAPDGNPLQECFPMQDGFAWGPVAQADVTMGGEQASNLAVQVIGQAGEASVPASCSNGMTDLSTLSALGANGILGVGLFQQDCGTACSQGVSNVYYSCPAGMACNPITLSTTSQVLNPVPFVPGDNNGVLLQLPAVSPPGAATLTGSLFLGIGTQANNGVGTAAAYTTDANGNFVVTYNGANYPGSISSGSNAIYFLNSTLVPQLPTCVPALPSTTVRPQPSRLRRPMWG